MLATILFYLSAAATAYAGEWREISRDQGIVVYLKPAVEGGTVSVRGDTTIDANFEDVLRILADNKEASEWMPLVVERRDLKQLTDKSRIEYTHIDLPWPVSDRYFINESKAEPIAGGGYHVSVKSLDTPPAEYLETGKVLGFLYFSELYLKPANNGKQAFISIEVHSDPRGFIPKWLINYEQRSWPRKFFLGLIKQLGKHHLLNDQLTEAKLTH